MSYTMRSAFLRWKELHNENIRFRNSIRIPVWFEKYIRNNTDWLYYVTDSRTNTYCNRHELDCDQRRRYSGHYQFEISDDELLQLKRPMHPKRMQQIFDTVLTPDFLNNLKKNNGINEFYSEDNLSIGISFEDVDEYENVYIFNLFCKDEYINIEGVYQKQNNEFVNIDGNTDLPEILTEHWNEQIKSELY